MTQEKLIFLVISFQTRSFNFFLHLISFFPFSKLISNGKYLVKEIAIGTDRVERATYFYNPTFVNGDTLESHRYLEKIDNPTEKGATFEVIASLILKGDAKTNMMNEE